MHFRKSLILIILILTVSFFGYCQTIKVMTYNIRYNNPNDGKNSWDNRKGLIVNQIGNINPDIIGTQEGLIDQIQYLSKSLSNYKYIGVGRDDGKEKGEFTAIFYRKDKYKVISDSTFWLSPTPFKHSVGWDAALERICTFLLLEDINSGKKFWIFNTHLDHIGKVARKESANLILNKIEKLNSKLNLPVVLTGDMNSKETDEPIEIFNTRLFDTFYKIKHNQRESNATFNGFNDNEPAKERIDYIFVNQKRAKVKSHITLTEKIDNRFPSDHFPVIAIVTFKK